MQINTCKSFTQIVIPSNGLYVNLALCGHAHRALLGLVHLA